MQTEEKSKAKNTTTTTTTSFARPESFPLPPKKNNLHESRSESRSHHLKSGKTNSATGDRWHVMALPIHLKYWWRWKVWWKDLHTKKKRYNLLAGTYRKSLRIGKKINLANWQTSIFGFRVSFGGRMCLLLGGVYTLLQK